jgi:hypothetical protein
MKPHADVMATMRRLLAQAAALPPSVIQAPEPPPPPPESPAPEVRYSSMVDAFVMTPADLRESSNNRPHTETPYTGLRPKTAAQAAKVRRKAMQACGCRLCALALNPPKTFAEWARLCGTILDAEAELAIFRGPRVPSTHVDNRSAAEKRASKDAAAWELATYGERGVTR